jgi:hypothetical protein
VEGSEAIKQNGKKIQKKKKIPDRHTSKLKIQQEEEIKRNKGTDLVRRRATMQGARERDGNDMGCLHYCFFLSSFYWPIFTFRPEYPIFSAIGRYFYRNILREFLHRFIGTTSIGHYEKKNVHITFQS